MGTWKQCVLLKRASTWEIQIFILSRKNLGDTSQSISALKFGKFDLCLTTGLTGSSESLWPAQSGTEFRTAIKACANTHTEKHTQGHLAKLYSKVQKTQVKVVKWLFDKFVWICQSQKWSTRQQRLWTNCDWGTRSIKKLSTRHLHLFAPSLLARSAPIQQKQTHFAFRRLCSHAFPPSGYIMFWGNTSTQIQLVRISHAWHN